MNYYAYGVLVRGKKRFGGCIHAESMEEAVKAIAQVCKLKIKRTPQTYLPDDFDWMLDGEKASVYVWAPPEYFSKGVPAE